MISRRISVTVESMPEPWEQLYQYWLSKNIDGRPPARANLDPMIEIPHLARHLMILDILPDGYQYRLAGSEIAARLGGELTGRRVGRTTATESQWHDLLDIVSREQKPLIVTTEMPPPGFGKRLAVVLPLVDASGKSECILAGLFFGSDFRPGMVIGTLAVQEIMQK
jgi:hypothetical protein